MKARALIVSFASAAVVTAASDIGAAGGLPSEAPPSLGPATSWPMYQFNNRHDGSVAFTFDTSTFHFLWQRPVTDGVPPNPVTAADGQVFCSAGQSLFALDAATGSLLWQQDVGGALVVNPPSTSSGMVYLQTVDGTSGALLRAYNAHTGSPVFQSPHSAQLAHTFAPTIYEGKVFVNGGSNGGMYGFDALSGQRLWFCPLPRYDQWTPAVEGSFAYAYVGGTNAGLYVVRRDSGALEYAIPDRGYHGSGYSMNLAPVIGDDNRILVVQNGRLICFDMTARAIGWQLVRSFSGQPSLSQGVIYAIDGGHLAAISESMHGDLWSWTPPSGALVGTLIVTGSHVLCSTNETTYAVGLESRHEEWSYPAGGRLAVANQCLYIASATGMLTAIAVVAPVPVPIHADAGPDIVADCAGGTANVRLDGTASEGEGVTFSWSADGITFDDAASPTPAGDFPLGTTLVVLEISLPGQVSRDSVLVTVRDTSAPAVELALDRSVLWPPNNKMVSVTATVTSSDACDSHAAVELVSVTSNEGDEDPADGAGDIQGALLGTADLEFRLRAEREGGGQGRIYTVCYRVLDSSGNSTQSCTQVLVPHDERSGGELTGGVGRTAPIGRGASREFTAQVISPPRGTAATLRYSLPNPGHVRVFVYDVAGRLVERLVDRVESAGTHEIVLGVARSQAAGVLLYKVEWEGQTRTGKFLLLR